VAVSVTLAAILFIQANFLRGTTVCSLKTLGRKASRESWVELI
jgi:hypothetical protein